MDGYRPTRRGFVQGGLATAALGFARPVFGSVEYASDILVLVFLRGGVDGLDLLPPMGGADRSRYEAARPTLKVPLTGSGAALTLDGGFGLHPSAAPLMPFYDRGRMAVVHAAGMHNPTRSHFEAQDFIEFGTPGEKTIGSGWLHRHLASASNLPAEIMIPALASGYLQPLSLLGSRETLTLADPDDFGFATGPWSWRDEQHVALRNLYGKASDAIHDSGAQTINSVDIVNAYVTDDYMPAGGAVYGDDEVGTRFKVAAQMISLDLGIRVVTLDIGGWDTHESQGTGPGGFFSNLLSSLSDGLSAFLTDLGARGRGDQITVVAMTEFGRRLEENADQGTDHGHAVPMLLFGDNVVGGIHGEWPGLEPENLFEGVDLEVTTDFRRVLTEVLIKRCHNRRISQVFPGYEGYSALGVVEGRDVAPFDPAPLAPGGRRGPAD